MRTSSRKFSPKFWPIAFSSLALSSVALAQFKASTELVAVDALVENKQTGVPIKSLTREDFEIYEDGVRQSISQFSIDSVPLSVVFLFDMTDSVRPVLKPLAEGALAALGHLKASDETAVMLYSVDTRITQAFTTDHAAVVRAIDAATHPCGGKPDLCAEAAYFNEGVFQAVTHAYKQGAASNRKAIIWLTDNVPNIPNDTVHSQAATMELLQETGVVVSTLLERSAMSRTMVAAYSNNPILLPFRLKNPPGSVHKYAAESGGIVIGARREEIASKLGELIDRLRSRYTIAYRPQGQKPEGRLCKIDVKLTRAALKREGPVDIRARRGYKR